MRDSFRPNVRLATNILMVIGTFLIAFNLSKISKGTRDSQIIEDCARYAANIISVKELSNKYNLGRKNVDINVPATSNDAKNFCRFYYRGVKWR